MTDVSNGIGLMVSGECPHAGTADRNAPSGTVIGGLLKDVGLNLKIPLCHYHPLPRPLPKLHVCSLPCCRWWQSWRQWKTSRSQRSCWCRHGYVWLSWGKSEKVCLCSMEGWASRQSMKINVTTYRKDHTAERKLLSSSDPHPEPLFWHSFWHTIWKYIWHVYSDILSDNIWHSFRHILWHSVWHSIWNLSWHTFLAYILTFFSDILSGISSEILCGWGPAGNTAIQRLQLRSGGGGGGRGGGGGSGTADIKSNNPYLTGGEKQDHTRYFQCLAWTFRASCHGGVKTKWWSSWFREHLTTTCRHWLNGTHDWKVSLPLSIQLDYRSLNWIWCWRAVLSAQEMSQTGSGKEIPKLL